MKPDVYMVRTEASYPEFPYANKDHPLYRTIQDLFSLWGWDRENPFREMVQSGESVLIKPNWAIYFNRSGHGTQCLITHTSLIKYLIDFLAIALQGRGKIIIGDAPLQSCNFEKLVELLHLICN